MAGTFLKNSLICFFCMAFFAVPFFSQNLSFRKADSYAKRIDQLKNKKKLTKYFYPNKSQLGALYGFYSAGKLVYLEAVNGGDQLETRYFIYLKDNKVYKAISKSYRYTKLNRRRIAILGNTETAYPKDLADSSLLEAIKVGIKDLEREKILEK